MSGDGMDDLSDIFSGTNPWEWWGMWGVLVGALLVAVVVVSAVASITLKLIGRRREWANILLRRGRWPFRVTLLVLAAMIAAAVTPIDESIRGFALHALLLALIASSAWLVAELFLFFLDSGTQHYRLADDDSPNSRKIRTQLQIVRRLVIAIIAVFAVGGMLMTFDAVRAIGASVLASAGIASVVAGLAAQSLLSNIFAGVQLAFSEAIRVGDVVVVDGYWGRIHQITLSYVVLLVWDQRTLVLPCTYFTTQPFENWTKLGTALLGTVYFEVDWRVDVDEMRAELDRVLADTPLWDQAASAVQVTEAQGGALQLRALVSAADSSALWDLRCLVREKLAVWLRESSPDSLPAQRILLEDPPVPVASDPHG